MPLDYDREAPDYDRTRGGRERASAAARAVVGLIPGPPALVLDLGGGTGLVADELASRGYEVAVADLSRGMLGVAEERLPGCCVRSDAACLPLADESVDVVAAVWLLHLLKDSAPVLDQVARVVRPGGRFVTTVDKAAAQGHRSRSGRQVQDAEPLLVTWAEARGWRAVGESQFGADQDTGPATYRVLALEKPTSP